MSLTATVYAPHTGNNVLAFSSTAKQINYIAINAQCEYDIHKARIIEFLKEFKPSQYSPSRFAFKALTSANIPCTPEVQETLRRIIMESASVIVVSPTAEFVGRFTDAQTAAASCPDNALVISEATELEQFTKAELLSQLIATDGNDKLKKPELAEALFSQYMGAVVEIPAAKTKRTKKDPSEKAPRVKSETSVHAVILGALTAGEAVNLDSVASQCQRSIATCRTQLNRIRNPKDAEKVTIIAGHIAGALVYVLPEFATNFTFDPAPEKLNVLNVNQVLHVPQKDQGLYLLSPSIVMPTLMKFVKMLFPHLLSRELTNSQQQPSTGYGKRPTSSHKHSKLHVKSCA